MPVRLEFEKNPALLNQPYLQELAAAKAFAIGGDHSVTAGKSLRRQWPRNPKWRSVKSPIVYICDDTAENRKMLHDIGVMNNSVGDKRKTMTFADKVQDMRSVYVQICQCMDMVPGEYTGSKDDNRTTKGKQMFQRVKDMKAGYKELWNVSSGTVSHIWQLVKAPATTWGLLWSLINPTGLYSKTTYQAGRGKAKAGKPPTSTQAFVDLGGLSTAQKDSLLKQVLDGQLPVGAMGKKAKAIKAETTVRKAVLDTCCLFDWDQCVEEYPAMCKADYLHQCTTFVLASKTNFPIFEKQCVKKFRDLQAAMKQAESAKKLSEADRREAKKVPSTYHLFCHYPDRLNSRLYTTLITFVTINPHSS
jgi:hypothetical protein